MNTIRIYSQDIPKNPASNDHTPWFQPDWNLKRKESLTYTSSLTGKHAAEEAARLLNVPKDELPKEDQTKIQAYNGPEFSVGDIVEVETAFGKRTQYLCAGIDWEEKEIAPERSIQIHGEKCRVDPHIYSNNGRVGLRLFQDDNTPYATATVNIPEAPLGKNKIFVKSYAENEGMAEALEAGGIAQKTGRTLQLGPNEVTEMEIINKDILEKISVLKERYLEGKKQEQAAERSFGGLC
jgi:hypothetical protein